MTASQWVIEPACPAGPVVACLPHGGLDYPAELATALAVSPDILWSDWLTRELYAFLPELGITAITTAFSRFVADVNRDPSGDQHGGFWTSAVAARMPNGRAVYCRPLTESEIGHRIRIAHAPFHQAIDSVIERLLHRYPRVLLLDLHSFGAGLDGDVILGDRRGVTARAAAVRLLAGSSRRWAWTSALTSGSLAAGRSAGSSATSRSTPCRSSSTSAAISTWTGGRTRGFRRSARSTPPSSCCGTPSRTSSPR